MKPRKLCHRIHAYYDGQLQGEEVHSFCEHVKTCVRCQKELKKLNRLTDFIKVSQSSIPDESVFNLLWGQVEEKLVREGLSFIDILKSYHNTIIAYIKMVFKPLVAVCFVFLLIMLPFFEQKEKHVIVQDEAKVKKIRSSTNTILLFKTKKKKWTVMWVLPISKQEEKKDVL
ncbi:MAG: zf-HC2 domain-containing protein [Candidatus Omnitrophica bacterium]|nr:zf-HC2 domain-containing protein [Candidatus Omnitrophota bacterium]